MVEDHVDRRLAAIIAADIAGYSRLMGIDDEGTLRQLKAHRKELVDPKITDIAAASSRPPATGCWWNSSASSMPCAAPSTFSAAWLERNADVPAERRIEFRIGINVGDIISDGNDIYGDGVNVAARLEALAEPGGIIVSRNVHDQVRDKLSFGFEDMGEQIGQEHRAADRCPPCLSRREHSAGVVKATGYRQDGTRNEPATVDRRVAVRQHERRPRAGIFRRRDFRGHHHRLVEIALVLRHRAQFVIHLQGQGGRRKARCPRTGVRYVLEGSVRKGGNRVRITAQLIDAATGNHIWADRYDGELTDVFDLQDQITRCGRRDRTKIASS